jgi:hypothetical protein
MLLVPGKETEPTERRSQQSLEGDGQQLTALRMRSYIYKEENCFV